MADDPELESEPEGISRRKVLRGAVIAGGTLVWSAPIVKSMAVNLLPPPGSCTPEDVDCADFFRETCLPNGRAPCCPGFECRPSFAAGQVECYCLPID